LFKSIDYFFNNEFNNQKALFIWGDSQAYQDFDLDILSNGLDRKVFSAAHHGAGVYDFLVFCNEVPENGNILVSISKLMLLRSKQRDYNRSGLSFEALKIIHNQNYSKEEVLSIFKNNLKPSRNINSNIELYPIKDSINAIGLVKKVESFYKMKPHYLKDKKAIFIEGIKILQSKKCNINFIDLPLHPEFKKMEEKYSTLQELEDYKLKIVSLFNNYGIDSILVSSQKNIFNDATHLNSKGAKYLSVELARVLKFNEHTVLYIAH
jgi:hypothetical protein